MKYVKIMKTMCSLQFPNGEIVYVHLWNKIDLNNSLKNN
jgi:hypothetical protein